MKITAAITKSESAKFEVTTLELEEPRADEVLIKIAGVGICHTDLAARDQKVPFQLPGVLGHEGAGTVEKLGANVTGLSVGDHVVLSYMSCGGCPQCSNHNENYCQAFVPLNLMGSRLDGSNALTDNGDRVSSHFFGQSSFGNYALANQRNVIKVRRDAPLELLGPLGCGIQTGAGTIMRSMNCEPGSSVIIVGGGAVGLSAVLGAVVQGCSSIIVVEPHEGRRQLALELGATHTIDPMAVEDLTAAIRGIVPNGANYAMDTTNIQAVVGAVFAAMATAGALSIVGVPNPGSTLSFDVLSMLLTGVKIKGVSEGDADPHELIPVMIDLFMEQKFPFDKLCKLYKFEDINAAVSDQLKGDCVKAILHF